MSLLSTPGGNRGTGHFYLAKNRTFLLCVDTRRKRRQLNSFCVLTMKRSVVSARSRIWEVGATPERASRFPGHAGAHAGVHVLLLCGRSRLPLTESDCGGIRAGREPSGLTLSAPPFSRAPFPGPPRQQPRVSRPPSLPPSSPYRRHT